MKENLSKNKKMIIYQLLKIALVKCFYVNLLEKDSVSTYTIL